MRQEARAASIRCRRAAASCCCRPDQAAARDSASVSRADTASTSDWRTCISTCCVLSCSLTPLSRPAAASLASSQYWTSTT